MKLQNKYKIALVGYRLSGGGSDKVMVNLSLFLEKIGVEVYVITVLDEGNAVHGGSYFSTYQFKKHNGIFGRFTRLKGLYTFFKTHSFDFIIDFRFRTKSLQEFIINKIIYRAQVIYTIHSWAVNHYIPENKKIAKAIYGDSFALVCVAKAIETKLKEAYDFKQLYSIYNSFIDYEFLNSTENNVENNSKTILFVGQLENKTKQLHHLLEAFKQSSLQKKGVVVKICGSGILESYYNKMTQELGLEKHVEFLGFKQPPYQEMLQAKFLVLCSAYEGFPNVLIEALNCNLPVVSYDLKSGPAEIIKHEQNGLLVKNQNINALANSLTVFFKNEELYNHCRKNAKRSVEKFEINEIGKQWIKILKLE